MSTENAMEKNPIIKTAKWAMSMMKNKIIVSLVMIATGFMFLLTPSGNMNGMVIIIAIIIIAAALINIAIHLIPKDRTKMDIFLSIINLLLIIFGVFCLITPATVEPAVKFIFAVFTIVTNFISLIEVFRIENKKSLVFFLGLFVAIIMIGLGIAMLVAGDKVIASIQQGIGVFLIINSVVNIWYIIRLGIKARKEKKAARN